MTQVKNKGMWLRPAEQSQKKNKDWILFTCTALLTYIALALAFVELTGFHKLYPVQVLLLGGIILCAIYGVLLRYQRQGAFYPAVLILLLMLVLLFRQQMVDGLCLFWNQLGDTWTAATGWVLPELETHCEPQQQNACLLLFCVLAGGVGTLLCCGLITAAPSVLAIALPGMVLVGMVFFDQQISGGYLLLVLMTAVLLLLYSGWGKRKAALAVMMNWIVFALVAFILISVATVPAITKWSSEYSHQLHEKVHELKYETKYTTLPEGDFTDYEKADEEAKPALIVTMEAPEALYLRGFTGAVFENDTWRAMDTQVLAENEDLLYWLNLNAFNPKVQYVSAIFNAEIENHLITVQNIGACSEYYYLPFTLSSGDQMQSENLNSGSVASEGERIYVFSSVSGGSEMVRQVLEVLQSSDDEAVLDYRKAESAYRSFVYSYYLRIPQEALDGLAQRWDKVAQNYGSPDELTSEQAQACVMDFMSQCFTDDGTAEDMELPLGIAEGSSYQYATVAALTLRYFGIPSRYAEGYVITAEMAAEAESGASIEVDSTCARGWVEVYQDGIGWIPLELTAGMDEQGSGGRSDDPDTEKDPNSESLNPEEGKELEETTADTQETEEPDGGSMTNVPKAIAWGGILIVLAILLLAVILVIRRKIILSGKEKKFRDENRRNAVAWIFADAVSLLEKLGFDRGNGSMQDLREPVRIRFGDGYVTEFEDMIGLNSMALFSSREMTEEQRGAMLEFRNKTLHHLLSETKWNKRLWMKWIECRY